jgi:hypothetical protein
MRAEVAELFRADEKDRSRPSVSHALSNLDVARDNEHFCLSGEWTISRRSPFIYLPRDSLVRRSEGLWTGHRNAIAAAQEGETVSAETPEGWCWVAEAYSRWWRKSVLPYMHSSQIADYDRLQSESAGIACGLADAHRWIPPTRDPSTISRLLQLWEMPVLHVRHRGIRGQPVCVLMTPAVRARAPQARFRYVNDFFVIKERSLIPVA